MSFPRQRFVLDTTAFSDAKLIERLGGEITSAVSRLAELISIGRIRLNISCYMPPSTFKELKNLLIEHKCSTREIDQVEAWIVRKAPNRLTVDFSAQVIYDYVSDVRERLDQGQMIVRKAINESFKKIEDCQQSLSMKQIKEMENDITKIYEDKYRQKIRRGVLDSLPDIDTLILAKELGAGVVSADNGIKLWTERLGIRFVEANFFPQIILSYLEKLEDLPTTIETFKKMKINIDNEE